MKKIALFYVVLIFGAASIWASKQYDDLAKLVKSGASEEVVIAFINAADSSYNLASDEVVQLKEYGASPHVIITAMKHKVSLATESNNQPAPVETTSVSHPPRYVIYREAPGWWRPWRPARYLLYSPEVAKMKQGLQIDVAALAYGALSANYEYLMNHQHGIVVEGSYYPGYSFWDSHGENAELAYRWHWAKSMNSGFVGAFVNGGRFYGHYRNDPLDNRLAYTQTSVTLGPDIGKRWVSDWGMSIVARVGYGYTWSKFKDPAPDQSTMDRLRWESGLDSELSIGYAF